MRILVTGATNAHGAAIVKKLAEDGHQVRAFGVPLGQDPFKHANVLCFAGQVGVGGSIEPALSERQVLVHASCMDAPGKNKQVHANIIDKGTLYARYAAEREQVELFVHLTPENRDRVFGDLHQRSCEVAEAAEGIMQKRILHVGSPEDAATRVAACVTKAKPLSGIVGGHDNAVTA